MMARQGEVQATPRDPEEEYGGATTKNIGHLSFPNENPKPEEVITCLEEKSTIYREG